MKITIFGMGYVGVVSAACLVRDGHEVVGVDNVAAKVDDLAQGRCPIQEPDVADIIAQGHKTGPLKATTNPAEALTDSDMAWICVGTPSEADGTVNLSSVQAVVRQIGRCLHSSKEPPRSGRPLIVLRSTAPPGTTTNHVIPILQNESGLKVGIDIHVVYHPEFLREGTAVDDFYNPSKIVVGEAQPGAAEPLLSIYEKYNAPVFRLALREAEMVKYYDNVFHALKITFANEVAAIAKSTGLDARKVADVFCADTKLNISDKYLRPGFAFGGSCLSKDLRAVLRLASLKSVPIPMLQSVLQSNDAQINNLVWRILKYQPQTVGMIGLAFKPGTDDMRESPHVKVAKALIGEGVKLLIYDPAVQPDRLIGSNKEQVQKALRHLKELLVHSLKELDAVDLIIINHRIIDAEHVHGWLKAGIRVLDLADIKGVDRHTKGYEGIYW
jgi:GDP-mannose 6-dehydrogenase